MSTQLKADPEGREERRKRKSLWVRLKDGVVRNVRTKMFKTLGCVQGDPEGSWGRSILTFPFIRGF